MNTWNRSIRISWFMSWPVADFFVCLSLLLRTLKKSWVVSFFYIQFFIDTIEKSNIQVYHDASRYVQEGFSSSVQPLLAWLEAHRDENPCECWGNSVVAGDRSPDFSGFGGHNRKVMIWCHGAIGPFCEKKWICRRNNKNTQRIRVIVMIRRIEMIRLMMLIIMMIINHHLPVTVGTLDGRILHQFIPPLLTGFYTSQVVSRILPSTVRNLSNGHLNPSYLGLWPFPTAMSPPVKLRINDHPTIPAFLFTMRAPTSYNWSFNSYK